MADYRTINISAGNYEVVERQPLFLEAHLSSCVGVALYDSVTGVGGLAHFLLPEPVSSNTSSDYVKYASSGLPLMIDQLEIKGAKPERMKAAIAGGAFSGNISRQDINLDIGGRTVDVVRQVLSLYKIQIVSSETGGFFSSRMRFNMKTLEVEISLLNTVQEPVDANDVDFSLPRIEASFDNVQPIPQVALKILRMINEDSVSFEDFATEVKKDQVISAQVLKFCNSAIFSGRNKIDTISDALLIIGRNTLARLLTTIIVKRLFSESERGYSQVQGELYHHAIGVALLSEKIAEKTGRAHPFSAYTAGLLHDIGKVVLDQFVASSLPFFYRDNALTHNYDTIHFERQLFQTDHAAIGAKLSDKWGLPKRVRSVIEWHHSPKCATEDQDYVCIVALANLLLHMFKAGPELVRSDVSGIGYLMTGLGMKITAYPELVDLIPIHVLTSDPESAIL